MLINRTVMIFGLMLVGFIITSISVWSLAFNVNSSNTPMWSPHWFLGRLPILVGVLLIIGGFKMLAATRVARPADDIDYEDPAS
ncbi:MAG: hypothetical protein ACRYG8_42575, partial [Janthinobacterium lividum]